MLCCMTFNHDIVLIIHLRVIVDKKLALKVFCGNMSLQYLNVARLYVATFTYWHNYRLVKRYCIRCFDHSVLQTYHNITFWVLKFSTNDRAVLILLVD